MASVSEVEAYIREQATRRGIPVDIALGVAQKESGYNYDSAGDWWVDTFHYPAGTQVIARTPKGVIVPRGTPGAVPTSFGPFQLRAGRKVTGFAEEAGLGDGAVAAGIDVTNPETWKSQINFALNFAAARGTFAGTWSTAVGDLARRFVANPVATDPGDLSPPGSPSVPGMPEPGMPEGPGPAPAVPPIGITVPDPIGNLSEGLKGVADAIAQVPTKLSEPFVDTVNQAIALMEFLGQTNIYKRIGMVALGAVLILIGIILFGVSFIDARKLPVPLPV